MGGSVSDMRFSVDKDDPGYQRFLLHGGHSAKWEVYKDGEPLPDVITADVEAGHAIVSDRDEHGKLHVVNKAVASRHVYGNIVVECRSLIIITAL